MGILSRNKKKNWKVTIIVATIVVFTLFLASCIQQGMIPKPINTVPNIVSVTQKPEGKVEDTVNTSIPERPTRVITITASPISIMINVKFREDVNIDQPENLLPKSLAGSIESIKPFISESNKLGANDMKRWFQVTLRSDVNATSFMNELKKLSSVEIAEFNVPYTLP
jgi:hypothetical protein